MPLPASGAISMQMIRNEFYGQFVYLTSYGTVDANLYNLNYYRGKWYYTAATGGTPQQFPSGTISFSNFYNAQAADPSPPPPPPSPPGP
jgi:hypothetical protein